ncbi:MAG TPA: murein L,D-transpeptidase catalytic domain family protein [Phnomibacter sp.]|nr:murein L,D-transpeptidase catalytic domain family protein [Phnomibacter sp.]
MRYLLLGFVLLACQSPHAENNSLKPDAVSETTSSPALLMKGLQHKVDSLCVELPAWLLQNGFNTQQVLIADLSMHSGLPRMVLVDVVTGKILDSGMVAHGAGGDAFAAEARFSNTPNSYCSSAGKYKIGIKYPGRFGEAFKLHGLEKTNDKAFERTVVLHAYDCVPDAIPYPQYICNSLGCPMVSYAFLKRIKKTIAASKQPMLLWILQ